MILHYIVAMRGERETNSVVDFHPSVVTESLHSNTQYWQLRETSFRLGEIFPIRGSKQGKVVPSITQLADLQDQHTT